MANHLFLALNTGAHGPASVLVPFERPLQFALTRTCAKTHTSMPDVQRTMSSLETPTLPTPWRHIFDLAEQLTGLEVHVPGWPPTVSDPKAP